MKPLSVYCNVGLLTEALLLLTGSGPLYGQTANTNVQVTITAPPDGASFQAPTNVQITAVVSNAPPSLTAVSFDAAPWSPLPIVLYLGEATNGVPVGPPGSSNLQFTFTWSN